jgi:hypothetical protein
MTAASSHRIGGRWETTLEALGPFLAPVRYLVIQFGAVLPIFQSRPLVR